MDGGPAEHKILGYSQPVSCLVDELANVSGARHHRLAVLRTVLLDIVPGGLGCHFYALLELLGRVDHWVVYPFFVLDLVVVCSH